MTTLMDFVDAINHANTREELVEISYRALKLDNESIFNENSFYNKVLDLCVCREFKLKGYSDKQILKMKS
jgi:hypothetical protein